MWIQNSLILLVSVAAFCRAAPKTTSVTVYPPDNEAHPQEYQPQYHRQQPVQYKQQLVEQVRPKGGVIYKNQEEQDPRYTQQTESADYEMSPPQPYQFSFDVNDDENTNYQNRKEQREGNKISGSYSVVDADGFIRTVTYTADPVEGFKAHVSREPTNIVVKVPTPQPSIDNSQTNLYTPSPKVHYSPAPAQQAGIQFNGAPVPRAQLVRQQPTLVTAAPRKQQTQQYLQDSQDLIQYQPVYQDQAALRQHLLTSPGQVNQFLAETSPQTSQLSQYSNSDAHLRG